MDVSASTCSLKKAAMKSPPTETGPPNPEEEKHEDSEAGGKSKGQSGSEKDSGYSDSSSESLSSEETNGSTSINGPGSGPQGTTAMQTAFTPIYILQNVVLKQSRLVILQPHVRRHRKRPSPSSYLPILRSYPRIAPRLAPPPSPVPLSTTSPENRPTPTLLEVSLRSLALLRRNLETQRSIRELRAHARLYERALQGEEGGWEHLQRAMEESGGYPKIASSSETSPEPATSQDVTMTSSGDADTHNEETMTSPEKSMTSSGTATSECTEGNV
ncbi:uncharacterized protein LOC120921952 [Rana temporaria]|uniref:uncharacterized protein LOC120921952 n=1 Tax=Rana temporaria TaxID=8407 RepID=UPI001AAD1E91|nr:uncharacterized protein LOC120921952 [Rana temporaria]